MTKLHQTNNALNKIPVSLPDIDILYAHPKQTYALTKDGELQTLSHEKAKQLFHNKPVMVCHAPYTSAQMNFDELIAFDVLELFAFVHPGKFCVPTPVGLASTLGIKTETDYDSYPLMLLEAARALLQDLQRDPYKAKADPLKIAGVMGQQGRGWLWTPFIYAALNEKYDPAIPPMSKSDLNIWKNLPEWAEEAPAPPPSHEPITGDETRERLKQLLGPDAEKREQQQAYATLVTAAFAPRQEFAQPHVVVAEAGTGVGKTLGYLSPASVWSEKNQSSVWISTYTKNLQRQVSQELDRLYPDPILKQNKVAVRKGRENYLCLLNFEEQAAGAALTRDPRAAIAAGIMARWAAITEDGDLTSGADFPGWLTHLLGYRYTAGLSDTRGECIYSACDHYHKCFVEKSVRKSQHASLVVANHALVMIQTALSADGEDLPQRYIFDEGHHLFEAADSAFAGHLTARETYDLRRWLRGAEASRQSRIRGLKSRAEDLCAGDDNLQNHLQDILEASRVLTADGWKKRFKDSQPKGACEEFILSVYTQIMARAANDYGPYSLETETFPLNDDVKSKAGALVLDLQKLQKPMLALANDLRKKLTDQADTLESDTRKRIEAVQSGLERRAHMTISSWINMLQTLIEGQKKEEFVDWIEIERSDGRTIDIGMYRHWVDPMVPFSTAIKPHAHGITITSATLRESSQDDWTTAERRTGASYLSDDIVKSSYSSPFNYADQTKVLIINDINKNDMGQVASAYEKLFLAANGGALGLFTAISRLKAVHNLIKAPLSEDNIPLYAQHMDGMDTGTLVDIFRHEENSCLLGTDAIRDGVDVPGNALRLILFDRVPWPRPTIMHKARRNEFGGKEYDERLTRFKLKQAYGRLIRRASDRGLFVMLDNAIPTRLLNAFPEDVSIERMGLADTVQETKLFLP